MQSGMRNHKETSEKLKLRDILPNNWPVIFESVKVMKEPLPPKKKKKDYGNIPDYQKWKNHNN